VNALIAEILGPEASMDLELHRSKLIRTKAPVTRFSITQPEMLEVVQYTPTEFELIGLQAGETTLTLWFGETALRYLVRVLPETAPEEPSEVEYGNLQRKINELFPNSMVQLIPLADKLIIRGQARDSEEAAQILSVVSGQAVNQAGGVVGAGGFVNVGTAARPTPGSRELPARHVISLLDVPGEQQIMLKVRVAELSRSALRQMGCELQVTTHDLNLQSLLGASQVFSALLTTEEVSLALRALATNGYSRVLAEPNLVTLNGQSASFIAGGEFPVPTVVGVQGVSAVSTQFRGFGTQLTFTPTIIDKDRIRMSVAPSFSTLNQAISVDGIPGLNTRAVITTVDLREGQWLAIAGLLQDRQEGSNSRVPLVGDIPVVGMLFNRRTVSREETELVVLVSPELIHPMDAQETPLVLPGMEVTEPTDWAFFLGGATQGRANCDHRSTAWPTHQARVLEAKCQAAREAKGRADYQCSEKYYVYGPHGLSR
jgi:pilus assembly protein CpaC